MAGVHGESLVIADRAIRLRGDPNQPSIIDGFGVQRCLAIVTTGTSPLAGAVELEQLVFRDGLAPPVDPFGHPDCGGGILIDAGASLVRLVDCEIHGCAALRGAGIYDAAEPAGLGMDLLVIADSSIHDNHWPSLLFTGQVPIGGAIAMSGSLDLRRSTFSRNGRYASNALAGLGDGGAIHIAGNNGFSPDLLADGCDFVDNSADRGAVIYSPMSGSGSSPFADILITHCSLRDNVGGSGGAILHTRFGGQIRIEDSLLCGNVSIGGMTTLDVEPSSLSLLRSTIADNGAPLLSAPLMRIGLNGTTAPNLEVSSVIMHGNTSDIWMLEGQVGGATPIIAHSLIERLPDFSDPLSGSMPLPLPLGNVVDVAIGHDPLFVDRRNGDYHLKRGSLAVDLFFQSWFTAIYALDLDGVLRPIGGALDAGCYEHVAPDAGPEWAGSVTDATGQTEDVLRFDGGSGGSTRKIIKGLNEPFTLELDPAPGESFGDYVLCGRLGAPDASEVYPIPAALGAMVFAPPPAAGANPLIATLASSNFVFGAGLLTPPLPLALGGTTSWQPMAVTLQAIISTATGGIRVTNAMTIYAY